MDLLIANSAEDVQTLCPHIDANTDMMGLALWPDAQFAFKEIGLQFISPNDLMGPKEHEDLAEQVVFLSRNWWRVLFPDIEEPEIDGLKISDLYEYEIEIAFSRILFNIYAVARCLQKIEPKRCLFTSCNNFNEISLSILKEPIALTGWLARHPWQEIFINEESSQYMGTTFSFFQLESPVKKNPASQKHSLKRKLISILYSLFAGGYQNVYRLIKQRVLGVDYGSIEKADIIISGGGRCLGGIISVLRKTHKIFYLPNIILGLTETGLKGGGRLVGDMRNDKAQNIYESLDPQFDGFKILDVSYCKMVNEMAQFIMAQYPYLNQHYKFLRQELKHSNTKAYITISSTASVDRLNIWAFYKAGIRTIWTGDGLGQPNKKIWKVVKSAFWPESPAEKWLVSENTRQFFLENGYNEKDLRVTGYLGNNFQGKPKTLNNVTQWLLRKMIGIPAESKVVMYASNTCTKLGIRLISEETYFEIFQAIKDISEAFAGDPNILTIIKLHPGVRDHELIEKAVSHIGNIKIIVNIPIHFLIDISDAVIVYHSSVGLETLYRGKHFVVYNQTDRPSYLTEIIPGLNKDPSKEATVRLVRDKENLYPTVMHLINTRLEQSESGKEFNSGLSYCLANADPKFNAAKNACKLLINNV